MNNIAQYHRFQTLESRMIVVKAEIVPEKGVTIPAPAYVSISAAGVNGVMRKRKHKP